MGDDGEDWPSDIEEGGGDEGMYGTELDSGWIGDMKGQRLLVEVETLILNTFLRRDAVDRACVWRSIFDADLIDEDEDENEEDDNEDGIDSELTIDEIMKTWSRKEGKEMNGAVASALCVRFGPPYTALQELLFQADDHEDKGARNYDRKAAFNAFTRATILPKLSKNVSISIKEVAKFMKHQEYRTNANGLTSQTQILILGRN